MRRYSIAAISLLCVSLFVSSSLALSEPELQVYKSLSKSQEWLNLLHYSKGKSVINPDSTFFLSAEGYKNPQAEFEALVSGLFDTNLNDDASVLCHYPARVNYILQNTPININDIPTQECSAYQEYQNKVPIDKVFIVFAAENNQSPSSMLGHTFLKIEGKLNNEVKQHAFSYFATIDNSDNLKFYADIITIGLDGAFILSPYQEKADEYLFSEKRSLWEFELNLSDNEKEILKQHLWELKEKNIKYKFITHNCNTALMNILKIANKNLAMDTLKPFTTPVEYIQNLQQRNKISNIAIEPSNSQKKAIDKFGLNYIGDAPKPSRFSVHYDIINNLTNINFSPVYQDIRDISEAYFPDLESKILDLSLNYNNNQLIIDKIDLLKMVSIMDYSISDSYSKFFRLGLENDLFSENSELKPIIEFGLGVSKKFSFANFYILPKIGYHYDNYSNYYIAPQIGAILRMSKKIKIINSYEKYFDLKKNNHGYDAVYNFYLGYKTSENIEVYVNYLHYNKAKHSESLSLGITLHF